MHDGCLLRGVQIIILTKLQSIVLDLLHGGYLGASLTKARARSYVWWMNKTIEDRCHSCDTCQRVRIFLPETCVLS